MDDSKGLGGECRKKIKDNLLGTLSSNKLSSHQTIHSSQATPWVFTSQLIRTTLKCRTFDEILTLVVTATAVGGRWRGTTKECRRCST